MKRLITLFLVLLISVWLGLKISDDPGYVMLSYQQWIIEMPLWFTILSVVIIFGGIYVLLRTTSYLGHSIHRTHAWFGRRKMQRALNMTTRGLIEFTEGQWSHAEKHLISAATHTDTPLINYLAAAKAAQEQNSTTRRDKYLRKAQKATPSAEIAIGLSQAQLQINGDQLEQAVASLTHLLTLAPRHRHVLKLLQKVYQRLEDWPALVDILPTLKKLQVIKPEKLQQLEINTYRGLFQLAAKKQNSDGLQNTWQQCPTKIKKSPDLIACYAQHLLNSGADEEAETVLTEAIKKHWDNKLIQLYGQVKSPNPKQQLAIAERWLNKHSDNAHLLLALGRICHHNQLWGKARTYFESSLAASPHPQTYAELAHLLKQIGEHKLAADYYQRGLEASLVTQG